MSLDARDSVANASGVDANGNFYCVTNTRGRWHPFDPRHEEVDARHILALANVPRFAGHTPARYSVAEHSLLVLDIVRASSRLADDAESRRAVEWAALVHDADEAYWPNDVPTPMKAASSWVAQLCERRQDAVFRALLVDRSERTESIVKEADCAAFRVEWAWVTGSASAPPRFADGGIARWVREWNLLRPVGVDSLEVAP